MFLIDTTPLVLPNKKRSGCGPGGVLGIWVHDKCDAGMPY